MGRGSLTLDRCNIRDNSVPAGGYGGGVFVDDAASFITGSENQPSTGVNVKINNNKAGNEDSDVSVKGGESACAQINGLNEYSRIGITARTEPEPFEGSVTVAKVRSASIYIAGIFCNDKRFNIEEDTEAPTITLVQKYRKSKVSFVCDDEEIGCQYVFGGEKALKPAEDPQREGAEFDCWLLGDDEYDFDAPVYENTTLTALFKGDHYHDGKLFKAWNSANSLPKEPGNYYLTGDVTLTATQDYTETAAVNICLNGHTVTKNGGTAININGGNDRLKHPVLEIFDCSDGMTGNITGCSGEYNAVIDVLNTGKFVLNGGNISGNNTRAIYSRYVGTVIINGGKISGNSFSDDLSSFNCAGIRAHMTDLQINGGEITGNSGRAVMVEDGTSFTMRGGTITGNSLDTTYTVYGGGIYIDPYASSIRFGGGDKIDITGNTINGVEQNVFLDEYNGSRDYGRITFDQNAGELAEGTLIGVSIPEQLTGSDEFEFTDGLSGIGELSNFLSDNGEYRIRASSDGDAVLYFDPIDIAVTYDANGGTGTMPDDTAKFNQDYKLNSNDFDPAPGYSYAGWLIDGTEYEQNAIVRLKKDTVVKAKWNTIPYSITYDLAGGRLDDGAVNPAGYNVESADMTLTEPVRDHYTFTGWTGTGLDEPTKTVTIPTGSTGDREYTANWEPVKYPIIYKMYDGELPAGQTNPDFYTVEDEITLKNPVRERSTFLGWYLMGSTDPETTSAVIPRGSSGPRTYMAIWGPGYKVKVENTEGGTVTSNVTTAAEGEEVALTAEPEEGYELDSIEVSDESGEEVELYYDMTFDMPASDAIVKATFKQIKVSYIRISGAISPASIRMSEGEERQLDFSVEPENAYNKGVTWSVDYVYPEGSVSVTPGGKVLAVKGGTARLKVVSDDGNASNSIRVDVSHTKPLKKIEALEPTCVDEGWTEHYVCGGEVCNAIFLDEEGTQQLPEEAVTIEPLGHDWSEPEYEWDTDNYYVIASRHCKREDCDEEETEKAYTEEIISREATETEKGMTTYIAEFKNEAFEKQAKTVEDIPRLINKVELTLEAPLCGTEVEVFDDDVSVRPSMTLVPDEVSEVAASFWVTGDREKLYEGRIVGGSRYQFFVAVQITKDMADDYQYTADTKVYVNGEEIEKVPGSSHSTVMAFGEAEAEHDFDDGEITTEPTCTEPGVKTLRCKGIIDDNKKRCEETKTEAVDELGHDWGEWKEKTDSTGHYNYRACSRCKEEQKVYIPDEECAHRNRKTINRIEPSCTEEGYEAYEQCTDCGVYIVKIDGEEKEVTKENLDQYIEKLTIPALGHEYGAWEEKKDSTGHYNSRKCKRCDDEQRIPIADPDCEHKERETVGRIEPTCTEDGYAGYEKCKNCGVYIVKINGEEKIVTIDNFEEYLKELTLPAKGHDWGEWKVVKEATAEEEGLEERVCNNDPSHKETRPIDRLKPSDGDDGQKPDDKQDDGQKPDDKQDDGQKPEPQPEPTPEDRSKQMGEDGTAFGPGASLEAAEAALAALTSDSDPAGTKFAPLMAKSGKQSKKGIRLTWKKAKGAKKYVVFANKCGKKNKLTKLATLSGSKKSFNVKKAAGKKLKKGTYYKFVVIAIDENDNVVSASKIIHVATKGGKVGNHKKVTVKKAVLKKAKKLKSGKSLKLAARAVPQSKKLKVKKHVAVRYESSNTAVASVSKKGVVKGLKKGTCSIYAYAQNGAAKKIKVTVK